MSQRRSSRPSEASRPLNREFYDRPTEIVARDLLGKQLVRTDDQGVLRGRIVEVVTEPENVPCAVLIRALEPLEGHAAMHARRDVDRPLDLARGPARLCQAFAIDRQLDGWDLTRGEALWIAADSAFKINDSQIGTSGRIGVSSAQDLPLRFFLRNVDYVSGPRRLNQS